MLHVAPSVSGVMWSPPVTVTPEQDLLHAARLMVELGIGSVLVVDGRGALAGILTESDFFARPAGVPFAGLAVPSVLGRWLREEGGARQAHDAARLLQVGDFMTSPVHWVTEDADLADVLAIMVDQKVKHVPVVREGAAGAVEPVGMVTRHDLMKVLLAGEDL